jgi:hypothetical protein
MSSKLRNKPLTLALAFCVCFCLASDAQTASELRSSPPLIVPGESVGSLRLGDSRARVRELFPAKQVDQEWSDSRDDCGTVINWVDLERTGNVFVHLRDGVVFQIDSATPRFKTKDGITNGATPEEVRNRYKGLRAFNLSNGWSEAEGGRPLVYWVDKDKGIGLAFAYYRRKKSWYLYHLVVFKPRADICPNPAALSSSDKRELPPYSLNPDVPQTDNPR